jgi:ATP-binding cassette subfamily F protein uup
LDRLATSLWVFEGGGTVHRHHGGWDAYLAHREDSTRARVEKERDAERRRKQERSEVARTGTSAAGSPRKGLSFKEARELAEMAGQITSVESERDELGERLADPLLYQGGAGEVGAITRRFQELEVELETLYRRWTELEEKQG